MASRADIIDYCDELLDVHSFTDYGPNGLQVPGTHEVTKVATAVSAHLEAIERAIAAGADLLIAHHGLFWDFHPRSLTEAMASRLRSALGANLSVAGYHLPLDAHAEIGNNAILRDRLGFDPGNEPFAEVKGAAIGAVGRSAEGIEAAELFARVERECGQAPLVQGAGPERVHSIGIVTGAGASMLGDAVALGLDALLTGEPAEHAMADAREGAVHFIAAGHYATETFGIRRLGDLVAERFGVDHEWIDVPNPV